MPPNKKLFKNLLLMNDALNNLMRNTVFVMREADIGSCVAIMSRERYIAEGYRQLSDTNVYHQVSKNDSSMVLKMSSVFSFVFKGVALSPRIWLLILFL